MVDAITYEAALGSRPARIAALLGMKNPSLIDDVSLADTVARGLEPAAAMALGEVIGRGMVVGGIVPEATLRRARKTHKPLSREMSERLYEIGRVVEAARHSYGGDESAAGAFLSRPHPMLDGRTPMDLARASSAGAEAVVNILRRADAGAVV